MLQAIGIAALTAVVSLGAQTTAKESFKGGKFLVKNVTHIIHHVPNDAKKVAKHVAK